MKVFRTNICSFKHTILKKEHYFFQNFYKTRLNFSLIKLVSHDNRNIFKYTGSNLNYEGLLEQREICDFLDENDSTVIL